jgi:predicted CoA-substrate-specific enzyme activase
LRTGGIDIGSRYIKYVLLEGPELVEVHKIETGYDPLPLCRSLIRETRPDRLLATGYGRYLLEPDGVKTLTEIRAVSRGARRLFPSCRTIIDIGGQDTKVIQLNDDGSVENFEMNDRCAAGTGRFLEMMAKALGYEMEVFGTQSSSENDGLKINSLCAVFAESEVITLITKGIKREQISAALHRSIVSKVTSLAKRVGIRSDVVFTGGCARNPCLKEMFEKRLETRLLVHEDPDILSALGAALSAV